MNWQEWTVALIGVAVAIFLLRKVWCAVRGGGAKCNGCTADCPLKNLKKDSKHGSRN